jgi:hypothetical protein
MARPLGDTTRQRSSGGACGRRSRCSMAAQPSTSAVMNSEPGVASGTHTRRTSRPGSRVSRGSEGAEDERGDAAAAELREALPEARPEEPSEEPNEELERDPEGAPEEALEDAPEEREEVVRAMAGSASRLAILAQAMPAVGA